MKFRIFFLAFFLLGVLKQNQAQRSYMIKDLNPGMSNAFDLEKTGFLAEIDNRALFLAYGKGNIRLLCMTDGTDLGTVSLMPPLETDAVFSEYTVSNGIFWFILNRDERAELYSTDGTWAGTKLQYMVENGSANFSYLRSYKDGVVFLEKPASFQYSLSRFDIQNGKTDLGAFNSFGNIKDMCVINDEIWGIGAPDVADSDRYLWISDGESATPTKVMLINQGSEFNSDLRMTAVGSRAFFFFEQNNAQRMLWVTDGTEAGTQALRPFENATVFGGPSLFPALDRLGVDNVFYFQAECLDGCTEGLELWRSDGTVGGTFMLGNLDNDTGDSRPHRMQVWKNQIYLTARNTAWNNQIWKTDGTIAGTTRILPEFAWNDYHGIDMIVFNDSLAFAGKMGTTGAEVFLSNGNFASTHTITDESADGEFTYSPRNFLSAGGKLYFVANTATKGKEMWCYDPNLPPLVNAQTILDESKLSLYPNPSSDIVILDLEKSYNNLIINILSLDGRVIKSTNFTASSEQLNLNISDLTAGAYLINIVQNGQHLAVLPLQKL